MAKSVIAVVVASILSCTAIPPTHTGSRFRLLYVHYQPMRWDESVRTLHCIDPVTLEDSGPICNLGQPMCSSLEGSPDGRLAAWFGGARSVYVVDLQTGWKQTISDFRDDGERERWELLWSPDGKKLFLDCRSSTGFGPIKIWDRQTQTTSTLAEMVGQDVRDPSWSPDGKKLAFAGRKLSLCSVEDGKWTELDIGSG